MVMCVWDFQSLLTIFEQFFNNVSEELPIVAMEVHQALFRDLVFTGLLLSSQGCCIFRPAFECCARQTLVEIVIFSVFAAKSVKKASNLQQISCFFFTFFAQKMLKTTISTSVQHLGYAQHSLQTAFTYFNHLLHTKFKIILSRSALCYQGFIKCSSSPKKVWFFFKISSLDSIRSE